MRWTGRGLAVSWSETKTQTVLEGDRETNNYTYLHLSVMELMFAIGQQRWGRSLHRGQRRYDHTGAWVRSRRYVGTLCGTVG